LNNLWRELLTYSEVCCHFDRWARHTWKRKKWDQNKASTCRRL